MDELLKLIHKLLSQSGYSVVTTGHANGYNIKISDGNNSYNIIIDDDSSLESIIADLPITLHEQAS